MSSYGIWWWDQHRVSGLLSARFAGTEPSLAPETQAQPPAEGWRLVALMEGYEAQLWKEGSLVASQWARTSFDAQAWTAFVRATGEAGASALRPVPIALPPSVEALSRAAGRFSEMTPANVAQLGVGALVVGLLSVSAFNMGQGLRRARLADRDASQTAALNHEPVSPAAAANREALKRVAAYATLAKNDQPLPRLALALDILAQDEITPSAIGLDGQTLTFDVPYADLDRLEAVAGQLRSEAGFHDIRPVSDSALKVVHLQMSMAPTKP